MSKQRVAQTPAKEKPKDAAPPAPPETRPITLADISVIWNDGERDHVIPGEKVALALAMAYRRINHGMGTWDIFTDAEEAASQLRGAERLLDSLAISAEDNHTETEALLAVQAVVEDARIRCELRRMGERGKEYRLQFPDVATANVAFRLVVA